MKKIIIVLTLLIMLTGCLIGDEFKKLNDKYCAETNADKRALIIRLIRIKYPDYPDGGLCGIENEAKGLL